METDPKSPGQPLPTEKPARSVWRTEIRTMEYAGWSKWTRHRGYKSPEARDEALAQLERSKDALYGWIEFRAVDDE